MTKFLNDIILTGTNNIQFKTTALANAGKIEQSGDDLVISNAAGDILLGNGSDDVFIGDGTNTVDIRFEQNMAIFADSSSTRTLTLGGSNTNLVLESPTLNNATFGNTTMSGTFTLAGNTGYIVFDYEPSGDTGEYTSEVPLLKVDKDGTPRTILSRTSQNGALMMGHDDTVALTAGDTRSMIKTNWTMTNEHVVLSAEGGYYAFGWPNNMQDGSGTTNGVNFSEWSDRYEFRFKTDAYQVGNSTTETTNYSKANNGLFLGSGGSTQFIDMDRNLKNIGTISSGAITTTSVTSSGHIKAQGGGNVYVYDDDDDTRIHVMASSNATEGVLRVSNGANFGLIARGITNNPRIGAYHAGNLDIYGFGNSAGADHADDDLLAQFNFGGEKFLVNGEVEATTLDINGDADISGNLNIGGTITLPSSNTLTGSSGKVAFNGRVSGSTPTGTTDFTTKAYVDLQISNLVDSAPDTLNTLNELAAALGDDVNFSTTITNSIATKLPLTGGDLTDKITITTTTDNKIDLIVPSSGDSSDWNYIQFIGANGTRDAYFGTTNTGDPSWYRDDGGTQLRLDNAQVYSNKMLKVNGELEATSLDINGNADISGTLTLTNALAVSSGGTGVTSNTIWLNSKSFANFASTSADWDTITTRGSYRLTGSTNNPFGSSHSTGLVVTQNDDNYGFQLFSKGSSDNTASIAYRYRGTSWEDWQYLVTQTYGDGRYLLDSEVTNLSQVKAFDSSDYATAAQGTLATNALPKSGGTMTGDIAMSDNDITGVKYIQATDNVDLRTGSGEYALHADQDGQVALYTNGVKTFETMTTGATVIGSTATFLIEGSGVTSSNLKFKTNTVDRWNINVPSGQTNLAFTTGSTNVLSLDTSNNATFAGTITWGAGKGILHYGSDRAILRADQVLEIQTNGTSSPTAAITLDTSQNATFAGNIVASGHLQISSSYPRIYLTDTDTNDDYSIINNNGTFIVYNDTDSSVPFAIAGNNNATFLGTVTANGTTLTGNTGTVTGTGTDNRIAIWNGTTAIDSDSDFRVDGDTIFTQNLEAAGNITASGNIVCNGTVDGRDVATDGTKLDGIESNATADQTAAEILTAIKTVDGAGTGLDADTVDGYQAANLLSRANHTGTQAYSTLTGTPTIPSGNQIIDWTAENAGTIHASNFNDNDTNTFRTIEVDTSGNNSADNTLTSSETLRFKKGSNITLAESGGVITISSTDTNTTYSVGDGGLTQNNFTNALKTKLDSVASNAVAIGTTSTTALAGNTTTISSAQADKLANITVSSGTDLDELTSIANGAVQASTASSISGAKTFSAAVTISDTTQSTNKTSGAVKIAGGVGIAKTLNVGEDVVAYASSDKRYKDNLQAITNPIDKVKSLTGYTFTWNDKHKQFNGNNDIGVVAQEVERVLPEIVDTRDNGYKAVKYEKMVALLIEAVKDQQEQIDELKQRLDGCSC